jgi:hypothetical protein
MGKETSLAGIIGIAIPDNNGRSISTTVHALNIG